MAPFGASSAVGPGAQGGPRQRRKLVIVGSGGTGKTSLLMVYARGVFPADYVPTVFENYVTEVNMDKKTVDLALWDTAGQEDYDRLRPLSYPDTDVVVLCYAVNDRPSLDAIAAKWAPEVDHFCAGAPKILVGLKTDMRAAGQSPVRSGDGMIGSPTHSDAAVFVSAEEGQEMAYRIGAFRFIECSAKYRDNVDAVFETSVRSIWDHEKRMSRRRRGELVKRAMSRCTVM